MFEDEHRASTSKKTRIDYVMSDASLLLPPTGTPLTGIDFTKRLPCGEVERARRAIRLKEETFFTLFKKKTFPYIRYIIPGTFSA